MTSRRRSKSSAALSVGDLSRGYPSYNNPLCDNLKNIQSNLNHLTWQAKQVAKGDYSQTVSYLGDFSQAFNTMTAQLREREEVLKKQAQRERGARRLKKQLCIKNPNPVFEVRIFLYLSSSVQTSFAILNAAQAFGQPA